METLGTKPSETWNYFFLASFWPTHTAHPTSEARKNANTTIPTYDLPSAWQYQASLPSMGQVLNFTYKPCKKMNVNPMSKVTEAITVGPLTRCFGFCISLSPGIIIAEDKITIAAIAEVTFKNSSTTSGKL